MKELIKISRQNYIETVDARELHSFLGIGKRFTTWLLDRIEKYGFIEDVDFLPTLGESTGGRPGKIYNISIDMAKELAMVENNEKGREIRRYFIEREKQARELERQNSIPNFSNPAEAARAWADQFEKREAAEYKVSIMRPTFQFAKLAIRDKNTQYSITDAGKHLGLHQKEIFEILRKNKLLTKKNKPTQYALDQRILQIKTSTAENGTNFSQAVMTIENMKNFNDRYNKFELESI